MTKLKSIFLIFIIPLLLGCKKNPENYNISDHFTTETGHFSFFLYDELDENIIRPITTKLENNYSRILSDLDVDSMNKVVVRIWNNESNFLDDMESVLGVRYTGSAGWIKGAHDIRILYVGNGTAQNALHEFCHAVSMVVNSQFDNNPRWLWEAVAIYESGEFVDPQTLSYLVEGDFPTLEELNSNFNENNNKIYQVGYLLSEYIIMNWGKNSYVNLIKSNGNIPEVLELTKQEFEENWKNYVTTKYLNNETNIHYKSNKNLIKWKQNKNL